MELVPFSFVTFHAKRENVHGECSAVINEEHSVMRYADLVGEPLYCVYKVSKKKRQGIGRATDKQYKKNIPLDVVLLAVPPVA
jgi:hypothetical protein